MRSSDPQQSSVVPARRGWALNDTGTGTGSRTCSPPFFFLLPFPHFLPDCSPSARAACGQRARTTHGQRRGLLATCCARPARVACAAAGARREAAQVVRRECDVKLQPACARGKQGAWKQGALHTAKQILQRTVSAVALSAAFESSAKTRSCSAFWSRNTCSRRQEGTSESGTPLQQEGTASEWPRSACACCTCARCICCDFTREEPEQQCCYQDCHDSTASQPCCQYRCCHSYPNALMVLRRGYAPHSTAPAARAPSAAASAPPRWPGCPSSWSCPAA